MLLEAEVLQNLVDCKDYLLLHLWWEKGPGHDYNDYQSYKDQHLDDEGFQALSLVIILMSRFFFFEFLYLGLRLFILLLAGGAAEFAYFGRYRAFMAHGAPANGAPRLCISFIVDHTFALHSLTPPEIYNFISRAMFPPKILA
jgi:hypothetical protein